MPADLHADVARKLAAVDLRYTRGRRLLVDVLAAAGRPLSIPDVLVLDPGLRQSSVYRNLQMLELAHVAHRVVTQGDFARYELAEDLAGHHHHLVCSTCGDVADVTLSQHDEDALSRALSRAARRSGFRIDGHRLDLVGVCGGCAR